MAFELTLHLFRFNAQTDYLPYYKHVEFEEVEGELHISEVLQRVAKQDATFKYNHNMPEIKINRVALSQDITVAEAVEVFGEEWTVDPFSEKHAVHDLIINDSEYYLKMETVLREFDPDDIAMFRKYKPYYYASDLLALNEDYISEAVIAFAEDCIAMMPIEEKCILKKLSDPKEGAWISASLRNSVYPYDESFGGKVRRIKQRLYFQYPLVNKLAKQRSEEVMKSYGFDKETFKVVKGAAS